MTDEPKPTWRERGVAGYPQNVSIVRGEGSRAFIEVEGWTVKESKSEHFKSGVPNQLCERHWFEGEIPFWMEKLILYGLNVVAIENPDRYYHMVHYKKVDYPPREPFTPVIHE